MPPKLVVCRCCATGKLAFAACEVCEARDRQVALERRNHTTPTHPPADAWNQLVASYFADDARLDAGDLADRARDAADDYRLERAEQA